jgi:hypothetical protein
MNKRVLFIMTDLDTDQAVLLHYFGKSVRNSTRTRRINLKTITRPVQDFAMNLSDLTHSFEFVDSLSIERNEAGVVDLKMPQSRYEKADEYPIHQYGWGPFCKFSVDTSEYIGTEGVYIFTAGYEIKYVGETVNIHNRIQPGYGNIAPKNCFEGGQQTNCRINHLILETARSGRQVSLWAEETQNRKHRETELIEQCDPPWNKASSPSPRVTSQRQTRHHSTSHSTDRESTTSSVVATEKTRNGKYAPLYDYLESSDSDILHFTMDEIEDVIDAPLPDSAKKYDPYWRASSQGHAKVWAELGWKANPDFDNMSVTFERVEK